MSTVRVIPLTVNWNRTEAQKEYQWIAGNAYTDPRTFGIASPKNAKGQPERKASLSACRGMVAKGGI